MRTDTPQPIFLKDYAPPPQRVTHVDMVVKLAEIATLVDAQLHITPTVPGQALVLDGEGLELVSLHINAVEGPASDVAINEARLVIANTPDEPFVLHIVQRCNPKANTALSGLYMSNGMYCTQMEAEGFRRFAFMQDRPDVMATYDVRIEAPLSLPVLLGNGNPGAAGPCADGATHFATWSDPHPKPTYLFALVAGDLAAVHDRFTTSDGRDVALGIYVEQGKQDRCGWAMECLKTSMRWDEERFGRTYDLDVFNIVAVSDFNMGAMENKGLNIFNDKYILARPDTATDADHINIERIIAHEYFHNWTGNRITCRDWFQLCLKEGLTVFRDQEFTSDIRSRPVKRIEDVKTLRARQFPEDQGPLAHPVRPESFIEINNFYTPTVYEKGAEICRMLFTLLGPDHFRAAMDLYFQRHDGDAATVEDFLGCMAEASGRDLAQFALWYAQAGTPIVDVTTEHDAERAEFAITIRQHQPDTPNQTQKQPLHMPLALALLDSSGSELPLLPKENVAINAGVLEVTQAETRVTFRNVSQCPLLSINRGFSAPVMLNSDETADDLLSRMAVDGDSFNQWEAAQTVARRMLLAAYRGEPDDIASFAKGLRGILQSPAMDDAYKALMLGLPGEAEITAALGKNVDATRVHVSRTSVLQKLATLLEPELRDILATRTDRATYSPNMTDAARRSLWLAALSLFTLAQPAAGVAQAQAAFEAARNMTIEMGALAAVIQQPSPQVAQMLSQFETRHGSDPLLMDKWFALQSARPDAAVERVRELMLHPAFSLTTPNKLYALVGGFAANLPAFHAVDGSGYALLADVIISLNAVNPQVASRMATTFRSWSQYDEARRSQAASAMQRVRDSGGLSNDVYEIISRTLGA